MNNSSIKNIALVIDSLNGGGAERVCLLLAKQFHLQGYKVHLILLKNHRDYTIPDYISVFTPTKPRGLFKRIRSPRAFAKQISDYLHSHGEFCKIFVHLRQAYRVMALLDIPNTWFVVHNAVEATIQREKRLGPIKHYQAKKSYELLNGKNIICVSKGIEQEIQNLSWITPNALHTIYNPLDQESIIAAANEPNPNIPKQHFIVHVGRFAKQKRHDLLFSALRQLPNEFHLVLLCKPSNKLQRLIAAYDIQNRVTVAGWQANPFNWIKHAACLVLSSDYEGFGLVLAEALTLKTPVVSTDCPFGPNEILTGELRRFLVPCNNDTKLAAAILEASNSKALFKDSEILPKLSADYVADMYLKL